MAERLQKYLARCGIGSRRASERLILEGRVRVNGVVVDELGSAVTPGADRVEVDGRPVDPTDALTYVALHKPRGVISSAQDQRGRRTVVDLVRVGRRIYPVGRLDFDSEGLILLTDDGDLAFAVTHPRHSIDKEYRVLVRGQPGPPELRRLRSGVVIDGSRTAPAEVTVIERDGSRSWLRVVLREGRNRQIRRMAEAVGLEVERLIRVRIGPVCLGDLRPGAWRHLRPDEVHRLRSAVR